MDAFSLSLIYGTYGISKRDSLLLAGIVGLFHFFMPLIGLYFGGVISSYFLFDVGLVVPIIFSIIGLEMIISSMKDEEFNVMISMVGFFLFGLSVSIDSFTTGIGLSLISSNYLMCSVIFMLVSAFFTYLGLNCGSRLNDKFGNWSTLFGGILMLGLAIFYIF